jgi:hypothetical protein
VRFIIFGILTCLLACPILAPAQTAQDPPAEQPKDQFFAGYITAVSDTEITVSRTVLGKQSSTRTFQITPETKIEGKPKVKAKVTVQFVAAEEGDRAVHIIVRENSTPPPQNKKQ